MKRMMEFFGFMVCTAFACAAESAVPPAEKTESLAETVSRFESLGLPSVAGAEYVNMDDAEEYGLETGWAEDNIPRSGNTWKTDETTDSKGRCYATFVIHGGEVAKRRLADGVLVPGMEDEAGVRVATWKRTDLVRDLLIVQRSVDVNSPLQFRYQIEYSASSVYLFALQLWQHGDTDSAVQVVSVLQGTGKSLAACENEAVEALFKSRYATCFNKFRIDYDWAGYRDGIRELIELFPATSPFMPQLVSLYALVEKRARGIEPIQKANDLPDDARHMAVNLARLRSKDVIVFNGERFTAPWLVPSLCRYRSSQTYGKEDYDIRMRGVGAIPILLALTDDTCLTESFQSSGDFHPQHGDPFQFIRNRPATRAEIAARILYDILPYEVGGLTKSCNDDADNRTAAREIYRCHADGTEIDWALMHLYGIPSYLDKSILDFLLRASVDRAIPALETVLLSTVKSSDAYRVQLPVDASIKYATIRGVEARSFIEKIIGVIEEKAAAEPREFSFRVQNTDQVQTHPNRAPQRYADQLVRLRSIAYGNPTDLLYHALAQDAGGMASMALSARLMVMSPKDAYVFLVGKAASEPNATVRNKLLAILRQLFVDQEVIRLQDEAVDAAECAGDWRRLFELDEKDLTALSLYLTIFDGDKNEFRKQEWRMIPKPRRFEKAIEDFGEKGLQFVRQRALARLDGLPESDVPLYPDEKQPTEKQQADGLSRLRAINSHQDAQRTFEKSTISEMYASHAIIASNPSLKRELTIYANTLTNITVTGDEVLAQKMVPWQGRQFDMEFVELLKSYCEAQTKLGESVFCLLERSPYFGGCSVKITRSDGSAQKPICGYSGLACESSVFACASWRTDGQLPKGEHDFETTDASSRQALDKALADICTGTNDIMSQAIIKFSSR